MSDTSPNHAVPQPPEMPARPYDAFPAQQPFPAHPSGMAMQASGIPAMAPPVSAKRGMYTAAAVINWVTLGIVIVATLGVGVIAAAWFVPMTVLIHKGAKGPYKHTGLGVCTLLFCNIISGILMLVDDSNRPPKPVS